MLQTFSIRLVRNVNQLFQNNILDPCDCFQTAGIRENTIHSRSFWPTGKHSHGNRFA